MPASGKKLEAKKAHAGKTTAIDSARGNPVVGKAGRASRKGGKVKAALSPLPPKPTGKDSTSLGRRLIANMERLIATAQEGGAAEVGKKFTVRKVKRGGFPKPVIGAGEITRIRATLGVSQTVFAGLIGASVNTIQAWEQGVNPPSGVAARFLAEVQANPDYWKKRVAEAAAT